MLVAPLLVRLLQGGRVVAAAAALTTVLAAAVGLQSYFSTWYTYRISAAQVRVADMLTDAAPREVVLTAALPDWPGRGTGRYVERMRWAPGYDNTVYAPEMVAWDFTTEADFAALEARLADRSRWSPIYVAFSGSLGPYNDLKGLLPDGALERMEAGLANRPNWDVLLRDGDVTVLRYAANEGATFPAATWRPAAPG
ncbi:hypothetical protein BJF78_28600 [Pseudonocardia sp. CNS-139]|nr:hypothetical protein BJF78_28600 [Pseudonocardia sp. CNS-139]